MAIKGQRFRALFSYQKEVKMKTQTALVLLLASSLGHSDAWFGGGGSSSSSSSGSSSGNKNDLSGSASVEKDKDGVKGKVSVEHKGDGWGGRVDVSVDQNGNVEGKASVSVDLGKRSINWNGEHFIVSLQIDHCNFQVYDHDKDGVLTGREWQKVFGDNGNATELFDALDMTTGDGTIDEAEFYFAAPMLISGCEEIPSSS